MAPGGESDEENPVKKNLEDERFHESVINDIYGSMSDSEEDEEEGDSEERHKQKMKREAKRIQEREREEEKKTGGGALENINR